MLVGAPVGSAAAPSEQIQDAAFVSPLRTAERLSPPAPTPPPPAPGIGAQQQQVLDLVNAERTSRGLAPLSSDVRLADAAQGHSADQAARSTMSHTGADGSNAGQRIDRTGFSANWWGENVAMGYGSPQSVMAAWMASPGHRANIHSTNATHLGVGLAWSSSGAPYWTQVFARQR